MTRVDADRLERMPPDSSKKVLAPCHGARSQKHWATCPSKASCRSAQLVRQARSPSVCGTRSSSPTHAQHDQFRPTKHSRRHLAPVPAALASGAVGPLAAAGSRGGGFRRRRQRLLMMYLLNCESPRPSGFSICLLSKLRKLLDDNIRYLNIPLLSEVCTFACVFPLAAERNCASELWFLNCFVIGARYFLHPAGPYDDVSPGPCALPC